MATMNKDLRLNNFTPSVVEYWKDWWEAYNTELPSEVEFANWILRMENAIASSVQEAIEEASNGNEEQD